MSPLDSREPRPLDGVKVLDLTRILAGPYATMKLGDMGADVIKVEKPGEGDDTRSWGPPFFEGLSTYFLSVNRSKRSITLDLKNDDAKKVLEKLVEKCDVVIENFRPGTLEKQGLSWDRIKSLNPRAIYCSISGYGHVGERKERASYDVIVQGETGVQDLTGFPDGPPVKLGISIADITAGQHAVEGVLLALLAREKTGKGDRVDIALADGILALLTYQAQMFLSGGSKPRRLGNAHPSIVPYQAFQAKDGFVNVGVGSESLWAKFVEVIGRGELAKDARFKSNKDRVANRGVLVPDIEKTIQEKPVAHWLEALEKAGIPVGAINGVPQALEIARSEGRGMIASVEHADAGPIDMVGNAVKLESVGFAPTYTPQPRIGEHTDEVLAELGYSEGAIAALRAAGAV
jgi:crotonobetainyl-CoA:carnitine CoA-transferase CaiB-like acyl-CoA transferase